MRTMAMERARTRKERENSKATSYTTGTGRRARMRETAARDSFRPWDRDAGMTRWERTGTAMALMSSGVMKSRPAINALACAVRTRNMVPRGLAPRERTFVFPRRPHQAHGVGEDVGIDGHRTGGLLQPREFLGPQHVAQAGYRVFHQLALHDLLLVVLGRVVQGHAHAETVELRLGQRVGAVVLHRVLGGDDEERPRQRVGCAVHRDLPLVHGLEQARLGAGRGAVDLVGEHHVGEDRAGPELELGALLVEDGGADDVRGQQVRGELDAAEGALKAIGPGTARAWSCPRPARPR